MPRFAFRIVNVFTVGDDRFSGNPLCVFEDARGLTDEQMQSLARQMNLSETTFVLPSASADARVRIFTPGFEMPFAGHPTLGTAFVVGGDRDAIAFEMLAGRVPVTRADRAWTLRAAQSPKARPPLASRTDLARMCGLPDDAIAGEPLWISTGVEQLVLPVASVALVDAAKPVLALLEEHGFSETRQEAMAYVWARASATELHVRFFFTSNGAVIEDPATGSACANLGGWMLVTGQPLPVRASLLQGAAISRPSRLGLHVDESRSIFVTGEVIELGRGTVDV